MEDLVKKLPQDIVIHHILSHIDYTSWVRVTTVSRTWRDLFRQWPSPPNIPWLWLTDKQFNTAVLPSTSPLRPHPPKEPLHSGIVLASYRQYLLMYDLPSKTHRSLFIYNPFTAVTYPLPPRPQLAGEAQQQPFFWGALTRPCLSPNTTFLIIVIDSVGAILICRLGDSKWTSSGSLNLAGELLNDAVFHGGRLYFVSEHRKIVALDFANLPLQHPRRYFGPARPYTPVSRRIRDGQPNSIHYNLVKSCDNELLLVTRYNFVDKSLKCPIFTVHKVLGTKKLVKVTDLGDQMLFMGQSCSRSTWHNSYLWPSDFFTGNSIYFPYLEDKDGPRIRLGKFCLNVVDRSCSYAVFHPDQIPTAYRPMWITPVDQR